MGLMVSEPVSVCARGKKKWSEERTGDFVQMTHAKRKNEHSKNKKKLQMMPSSFPLAFHGNFSHDLSKLHALDRCINFMIFMVFCGLY
jgi:hypothetical protein